jgi:hypothetical protein
MNIFKIFFALNYTLFFQHFFKQIIDRKIYLINTFGYIKKNQNIYIFKYTLQVRGGWDMPLTRKARVVGSSLVVTIPSQLAKAHDIGDGDEIEIIPTGIGEFKIRKLKK